MHTKRQLTYTQYTGLLCFVLIGLSALVWLEQYYNSNTPAQLRKAYDQVQQTCIDKEITFINLSRSSLADTLNLHRNWSEIIELAEKENITIHVFRNDSLFLWSNNSVNHSDTYAALQKGIGFCQSRNGYYLTFAQDLGQYRYGFLLRC